MTGNRASRAMLSPKIFHRFL
jgi:hypothetical protein